LGNSSAPRLQRAVLVTAGKRHNTYSIFSGFGDRFSYSMQSCHGSRNRRNYCGETKQVRDMIDRLAPPTGAMEGKGAYNRHAKHQASGGAIIVPLLERVIAAMGFDGERPIVIVDYGAAQGKNSLGPMRKAIEGVRARVGVERAIIIYHEDLPINDFNALIETLHNDPDSYVANQSNVFPCAIGRSFYEQVLPQSSVDIGWSSYAAMWISRVPMAVPGHFLPLRGPDAVRAVFERQLAADWERFLCLRAREMRPGGRLVVSIPGANDDGSFGFDDVLDRANATLADMVEEGAITAGERARMVHGGLPRPLRSLVAPFERDVKFAGLTVKHSEVYPVPDVAWDAFEKDGDREALAQERAMFFRVTFAPTLAGALANPDDLDRRRAFFDRIESGLQRRLTEAPAPVRALIAAIVVAKGEAG
jgi:SAM dependent carboxyl methyltransferase